MDVRRMRPKPKTSPLDKKIVKNPRYKNVENVVDTGNNLRKELEKLEEGQGRGQTCEMVNVQVLLFGAFLRFGFRSRIVC